VTAGLSRRKGYGLANVELAVPVTPRSVFQTGSVGKQFTAAAVMMLVEEGRVTSTTASPSTSRRPPQLEGRYSATAPHHTSGIADYGGEESTMARE
jgi:hypothetical protein